MQQTTAQGGTEEIALVELQMGEHHGLFAAGRAGRAGRAGSGLDLSFLFRIFFGGKVASLKPLRLAQEGDDNKQLILKC